MGAVHIGLNAEYSRSSDKPFEWAVEEAARMGYKWFEPMVHFGRELMSEAGYFHTVSLFDDPFRIKEACDAVGLKISGLQGHGPLGRPEVHGEYIKLAIRTAAEIGAPVINTDEGIKAKWTTEEEDFVLIKYTLQEAAFIAERRGVKIGLEPHAQYSKTPEGLDRIYNLVDSPSIGINLDTGNAYLAGQDVYAWLDRVVERHVRAPKASGNPPSSGSAARDLIRRENAKPGTRDWMLTNTRIDPETWWRCPWIEGYCSEMSVRAGDALKIMVSTNPVSEFSLEIFRTGYYGGDGGRFMKRFDSIKGQTQPDPPIGDNRLRECKWEPSVEFEIPNDWLSGVYLGKLTAKKEGLQSYVIFVVRDDRPCDLLFQCSDVTWQAYNSWPDDIWSLYHDDKDIYKPNGRKKWSTGPDTGWVSFDRPYALFCQDHLVENPASQGSGEFLLWEFPLSYWMEQHGYDVSYLSNVDTHADGPGLQRAKGFISVGHDEYWTREMYDNVSAARDAGVNLAFLSGNSVWGVVPLLPSADERPHRIIRREGVFVGEELGKRFQKGAKYPPGPNGALLMGGMMAGIGVGDWVCAKPDHWLYEGTGMKEGETIEGLIGWEWHGHPASDLPGMEILANSTPVNNEGKPKRPHAATIYDGPKGNVVFNAGTIWWAQGLSSPPGHVLPAHKYEKGAKPQGTDPRVQRMMENLFTRFTE